MWGRIYSILIVEGLQAKSFNTPTPSGTVLLTLQFFYDLNCLGDRGSQKLKKYMSIGKEKSSGRSTALSGISLWLAGT